MPRVKDGSIHVVLEYMDRGSLGDVIHGWRGMEYGEDLMAAITLQVCWRALESDRVNVSRPACAV